MSAGINYAHASKITDGFTGTTVMPFIVSKQDLTGGGVDGTEPDGIPEYYFEANTGGN